MEQQSLEFAPPETLPLLPHQTVPPDSAQATITPEIIKDLTPEERQLVRTIPRLRNRAVRREAENALRQAPPETLMLLFAALQKPFSRRWREAQIAAWILGRANLHPEQKQEAVEALTRLLQIPVTRKERLYVTRLVIVATATLSFILTILIMLQEWLNNSISLYYMIGTAIASMLLFNVLLLPVLSPFSLMIDAVLNKRKNPVRATAVTALGRLAVLESVDVLAETLRDTTPAVHNAALHALVPLLTPAHYGRFGLHVTNALCRALHDKEEAWVLECLAGLEKVGDSSAISAVERLSRPHFHFRETWEGETTEWVRERATQVLNVLEQRRAQEDVARHLLRASGEPSAAPDILLRPSMGDNPSDGTQLLRAASDTEA